MLKLNRFFPARAPDDPMRALYIRLVAEARDPAWYRAGVPDTVDGRFDALATVLSVALLRLEAEGTSEAKRANVRLTEIFIDNMDSELRQLGTGDMVVGKNIGRLVSQLGGRLGAFRNAWATGAPLGPAIARNLLRDESAGPERTRPLESRLNALRERLAAVDPADLLAGSFS